MKFNQNQNIDYDYYFQLIHLEHTNALVIFEFL